MKIYAITVEPLGAMGTPLKGDTLFGHFCWQAAHEPSLLNGGLDACIQSYDRKPFAIFSSAFPTWKSDDGSTWYALKRPDLPLSSLFSLEGIDRAKRIAGRKELKKKKWMITGNALTVDLKGMEYLDDTELFERISTSDPARFAGRMLSSGGERLMKSCAQPHNSINRLSGTTGSGAFAPYEQTRIHYFPGTESAIFVALDDELTDIHRVRTGLKRIGMWGFGKDASTGMGRFRVTGVVEPARQQTEDANACYCLAPCVPEKDSFSEAFFVPFCRFGKHGDTLARSPNPFKTPVIMADEGAVLVPKDATAFRKPYIGRAVRGISKIQREAVAQGYSMYVPLKVEL